MEKLAESTTDVALIIDLPLGNSSMTHIINTLGDLNISVYHLETRPKKKQCELNSNETGCPLESLLYVRLSNLNERKRLISGLGSRSDGLTYQLVNTEDPIERSCLESLEKYDEEIVPWFPRRIEELDQIANNVLMYGTHLDCDHPSFKDDTYRRRRMEFAEIAFKYRHGATIPRIEYNEMEKRTWGTIYRQLMNLYKTHACKEFLECLPLLQKYAAYREDDIPQLEDISKFLHATTGFTVRPVAGYLSARDFLSGLAFRVFFCTQYIRHQDNPTYTPEPDCVHEIMGHIPMMANASFARFSQEIGLASLGVSDMELKQLASLYFFTVEFGICKQDGQLRAYGAGLLSSIAELQHALSSEATTYPFVPSEVINQECMVTTYQRAYYITTTFEEAKDQMRNFTQRTRRPFFVHYNPYARCVEVLERTEMVMSLLNEIKAELSVVDDALYKFAESRPEKQIKKWKMADLETKNM